MKPTRQISPHFWGVRAYNVALFWLSIDFLPLTSFIWQWTSLCERSLRLGYVVMNVAGSGLVMFVLG
jgi:hypothetical protein